MDTSSPIGFSPEGFDTWSKVAAFGIFVILVLGVLYLRNVKGLRKEQGEAHETSKRVLASIQTNHGSKNLGDAVDRLTTSVDDLKRAVDEHIKLSDSRAEMVKREQRDIQDRVSAIEQDMLPMG